MSLKVVSDDLGNNYMKVLILVKVFLRNLNVIVDGLGVRKL